MMKKHEAGELKGKLVNLVLGNNRPHSGSRLVKIKSVKMDRKGRIKGVSACMYDALADDWVGRPIRLDVGRELLRDSTDIVWFGRGVPLLDWLAAGKGAC